MGKGSQGVDLPEPVQDLPHAFSRLLCLGNRIASLGNQLSVDRVSRSSITSYHATPREERQS